jgi:hypothetical protein
VAEPDAEPDVRGPDDGHRGPRREKLVQREVDEFLRLLSQGKGRDLALVKMGISYRKFRNTYVEDEEFREAVRSHQRAAIQDLEENGHMKALAQEGADTLLKILDRNDRGRDLNEARAEKAREREFLAEQKAREQQFLAEQKALDRAHQLELARLRTDASARGGPDATAVAVAIKVASLFAPHIDPAKRSEVTAEFEKICNGAGGIGDAGPS